MLTNFQLSESDNDQLRELINIGVSHAGNTLSEMVGKRITVSVPTLTIRNAESAAQFMDHSSEVTIAILLRLSGVIDGYVFIFFPHDAAVHLLKTLSGKTVGDLRALDRFDRSIFQELGNVITGGMLQGLSRFLHIEMMHSVPDVVVDMGQAMFNSLVASMVSLHEEFVSLDVSVCVNANQDAVLCFEGEESTGRMFLFVGPTAVKQILKLTNAIINKDTVI
jgi:chemotaxis protein CheY-P-specific phosphatase CheC